MKNQGFGVAVVEGKEFVLIEDYQWGDGKVNQYLDGREILQDLIAFAIAENGDLYKITLWANTTDMTEEEAEAFGDDASLLIDDWEHDGSWYWLEAEFVEEAGEAGDSAYVHGECQKVWERVLEDLRAAEK